MIRDDFSRHIQQFLAILTVLSEDEQVDIKKFLAAIFICERGGSFEPVFVLNGYSFNIIDALLDASLG